MAGFPVRPSRDAFGPKLEDGPKVTNPKKQIGEKTFNLAWWQLAAVSQLIPLAWANFDSAGAGITSSAEGWNPNQDPSLRPTVLRTGPGVYVVTYQATYLDEEGVARPLSIVSARATPQGTTPNLVCVVSIASGRICTVRVTTANTGAATDAACELVVR